MAKNEDKRAIRCSFCGKSGSQVRRLLTGQNANICDECVLLCRNILGDEDAIPAIKGRTKEFGISMLDGMLDGISEDELRSFLSTLDKISKNLK